MHDPRSVVCCYCGRSKGDHKNTPLYIHPYVRLAVTHTNTDTHTNTLILNRIMLTRHTNTNTNTNTTAQYQQVPLTLAGKCVFLCDSCAMNWKVTPTLTLTLTPTLTRKVIDARC
jgi:hypothetical protein